MTLRLGRVDLPNKVELLITNLTDESEFDASIFKSLYQMRWGIEESCKRLKKWVEIENFSGKYVLSVKQDFHAKIVAANLTSLIGLAAQKIVVKKTSDLRSVANTLLGNQHQQNIGSLASCAACG